MNKFLSIFGTLFIVVVFIMGYYFLRTKNEAEKKLFELNEYTVDMVLGEAIEEIENGEFKIYNIKIKDRKLEAYIYSEKYDLLEKRFEFELINDNAAQTGIVISGNLSDFLVEEIDEKTISVSIDINDVYNNPTRVRFEVKWEEVIYG